MKLLRRAAWISLLLAPLFFGTAVLLSSGLGDSLEFRIDKGYCVTMRRNPTTGRLEEVPKVVNASFAASLFGALMAPPVLWFGVLIAKWIALSG
jgi:hypothetical protein